MLIILFKYNRMIYFKNRLVFFLINGLHNHLLPYVVRRDSLYISDTTVHLEVNNR